jgi:hypothetical protein
MEHRSASWLRGLRHRAGVSSAVLLAAAILLATPGTARAAQTTLQVVAVGHGSVSVTPAPSGFATNDPPSCASPQPLAEGSRAELSSCTLTYEAGTAVTIVAVGGPADGDGPATSFGRWSDDRCPPINACTLTLGAEPQTVVALFTPQRVSALLSGVGSVTSAPAGLSGTLQPPACVSDGTQDPVTCSDDFPLDTIVTLYADPLAAAVWLGTPTGKALPLCDTPYPPPCALKADRPRWGSVGFSPQQPSEQIPPEVSVRFRVLKDGSGSGTVRSGSVDCGAQCAVERTFGASETLVAVPDGGSRFERWRAACGSDPTCRLAVGPVTAVTAVFERTTGASTTTNRPSGHRRALTARILRLNVRGKGRRRAILIRLQVNAAATVRARLLRGRRQVASRRWRLRAGQHLLRLRVPRRARPGVYRVRLTVSGNGQTKRIARSVRLGR